MTKEQHAIVEEIESRLSVVEKLEETIEAALRQAEALRKTTAIVSRVWSFCNVLRDAGVSYSEIIARDKTNLDIFWLKDASLTDLDNLPDPDTLAEDIIQNIEAALEDFRDLMATLNGDSEY